MASNPAASRAPAVRADPERHDRDGPAPDPHHGDVPVPSGTTATPHALGLEWVVEARGCDREALADPATLQGLFRRMIEELDLNEVEPALWHVFPGAGGVTGMSLLAESHLTCHTFPEHGTLCLNLFCCRPRPEWDFDARLAEMLGAGRVDVRRLARRYVPARDDAP